MLCWLLVSYSHSDAVEVCAEKGEFVHFLKRHQLQGQKIKVQGDLIVELKSHIADLEEGRKIDQRYREAAEPLIEELKADREQILKEKSEREYSVWLERGRGFAVGVGLGVLYLIVK